MFFFVHSTLIMSVASGSLPCVLIVLDFVKRNPADVRLHAKSPLVPTSKQPLAIACHRNHSELLPTLVRHTAMLQRLYTSEEVDVSGSSRRRHSVYSLGSQPREEEVTPLHIAAGAGSTECVKILLADFGGTFGPNIRTDTGETPLHYACCSNQPKTAKALIELGAKINLCDVDGANPIYLAAEAKSHECVRGEEQR